MKIYLLLRFEQAS